MTNARAAEVLCIATTYNGCGRATSDELKEAISIAYNALRSASLRPKGEWIYNTDDFTPKKRCTNCGYNKPLVAGEAIKQEPDNYCPNCGADMRGETHDS